MMAGRTGSLTPLLGLAATAAASTALAAGVRHDGHPTHLAVLGTVVVVVAAVRRLGQRTIRTLPAVSAALAAQPALHRVSELGRPHGAAGGDVLHHLLAGEVPTAGVQIVVPTLFVVAVTVAAHLLRLLIDNVRRPLIASFAPCAPPRVLLPVRVRRHGSMLRWCGWVIRAARRGPPLAPAQRDH